MKIGSGKPRRGTGADIDMVPMINFAFLLLIFVMLVGAISAPDVLGVRPPQSSAEAAVDAALDVVAIDAEGRVAFGGEILQPDTLVLRVQQWRQTAGERPLLVKADAGAEAERVVLVLETLRAAGVARVSLLTARRRSR